jgi:hypothetical protein
MYMLHPYMLKNTSLKDFPSLTDLFESLNTAEGSSTTANNLRPTGKQPLCPHNIMTRL